MIRVKIATKQGTAMVDFSGVHVQQRDGTGRVPVGEEQGVILIRGTKPDDDVIRKIWSRLELNEVVGEGDDFKWNVENP